MDIAAGFDIDVPEHNEAEVPAAPLEISDNSQFTVMPKGTQLAVPDTFASFVSKSEKQSP
jgi:hypothetical protein